MLDQIFGGNMLLGVKMKMKAVVLFTLLLGMILTILFSWANFSDKYPGYANQHPNAYWTGVMSGLGPFFILVVYMI